MRLGIQSYKSHIGLLLSVEEEEEMRKVFKSPLTVSSRTV